MNFKVEGPWNTEKYWHHHVLLIKVYICLINLMEIIQTNFKNLEVFSEINVMGYTSKVVNPLPVGIIVDNS